MPIVKPAARPPVRGIPRFPAMVEICPVSVSELPMVVNVDCDTDWSLSQLILIILWDWRYIKAAKSTPIKTASIFITRFIANPIRKSIIPPEPIEKRAGEIFSMLNTVSGLIA